MANGLTLLTQDAADLLLGFTAPPAWGVYLNGTPVIQPASPWGSSTSLSPLTELASLLGGPNISPAVASTVDFEFAEDWPLSNYPQEQGGFQTYDKVTLPWDVKLRLAAGGGPSNRQAFLSTCLAIANSFALFDVVTPEMTFTSCNVTHISWRRSAENGVSLIVVDMWFEQVPVTGSETFTNTQQPGDSGQQAIGNVQAQSPDQSVQSAITGGDIVGSPNSSFVATIPGT